MLCPRCGFDDSQLADQLDASASEHAAGDPFVTIARFAWASEAGYFAHELARSEEYEPRIVWEDRSDQLHGFWQGEYLLQVPKSRADEARGRLRALLDDKQYDAANPPSQELHSRREESFAPDSEFDPQRSAGLPWVPIFLTLTAGSVAIATAQIWSQQGRAPVAQDASPEQPLRGGGFSGPRVFTHEGPDGTWTLRYDPDQDRLLLIQDENQDGRPDRRRFFHAVQ